MKKLIYILTASLTLSLASSCGDFLDTEVIFSETSYTYYKTPAQINDAMAGVYNAFYAPDGISDEHLVATLLEDVTFGGGGSDDNDTRNISEFQDPRENTHIDLWKITYKGLARVNVIIESVQNNDFTASFNSTAEAETFKKDVLGEAYFLRGFLMFRAARFFGGIPVITASVGPYTGPRNSFTETFAQIASDFKQAVELMEDVKAGDIPTAKYGRAYIWAAKGYLARAYMFYTGYQTNIEKSATDVLPTADGGSLSKTDIVAHLDDVIANSGYELTPDFRNLWPYSYVNQASGENLLPWATTNNLAWVGQDGYNGTKHGTGNKEVMFALRYASAADWGETQKNRNWVTLFCGIRKNSMIPFGEGWGMATVHPVFFNNWNDDDTRKLGSVIRMEVAEEGTDEYTGVKGNHETGFFNKKYTNIQYEKDGATNTMWANIYSYGAKDFMLAHAQDFYYLRFADILLMHSELTETATGLNEVHRRAYGAAHVDLAYSIDALKEERLREFAFEGIRWFDLVRWGDVEGTKNYYSKEGEVTMEDGSTIQYKKTYRPETKGLRPIPESEVKLSNGAYTQNPGW